MVPRKFKTGLAQTDDHVHCDNCVTVAQNPSWISTWGLVSWPVNGLILKMLVMLLLIVTAIVARH